jgi:hypothetical protein
VILVQFKSAEKRVRLDKVYSESHAILALRLLANAARAVKASITGTIAYFRHCSSSLLSSELRSRSTTTHKAPIVEHAIRLWLVLLSASPHDSSSSKSAATLTRHAHGKAMTVMNAHATISISTYAQ